MALIEKYDFPSYKPPFMVGIFHGYVKWPDGIDSQLSQKDQLDENKLDKATSAADNIFRQWWTPHGPSLYPIPQRFPT